MLASAPPAACTEPRLAEVRRLDANDEMAPDLLTKIRADIEVRMRELRPMLEEYESLLSAAAAVENGAPAAKGRSSHGASKPSRSARSSSPAGPVARRRAPRGAAQQAILAALEHGSHTVSELAVVTAMPAPSIRQNLRRLTLSGAVTRTEREGRLAYAASSGR
jgi:predicted Rossmann fold nucleotide-binding protein DprA/Smf involved in DNA uptake